MLILYKVAILTKKTHSFRTGSIHSLSSTFYRVQSKHKIGLERVSIASYVILT